jgi:integrase
VITKRRKTLRTKEDAIKAARRISGVDEGGNIIINNPSLPSRDDLGRLVRFLHTAGAFPLVKRCVLLLHLYSVQRRFTIATALRQTILHAPKAACGMWVLDGDTTKAGRPHVLPFSKRVYAVIEEWKRMLPPGDWLFPGMPTKAKPMPTGHLSRAPLTPGSKRHGFYRVPHAHTERTPPERHSRPICRRMEFPLLSES